MTQSALTRFALGPYVVSFGVGAINHARDFLTYGWRPYAFAPRALEAFWTSLLVLDVLVIVLVFANWRRSSLLLAAVVMISDVSADAFASFVLERPGFAVALPLQAAFLGFVLGSMLSIGVQKGPPIGAQKGPTWKIALH